jgi:NAD(P)-dependent dehydrogenase (short-subunit alcohol dehydrogenase family)
MNSSGGGMAQTQTAIVAGVGPGLGWALAKRFAGAGMQVAMAARSTDKLDALLESEPLQGARAYACDVADRASVERLFGDVARDLGTPDLVVFNAGAFQRGGILDIQAEDFERCWRIGCLGGFHVGQAAARRMLDAGRGTIIFTGATASLRGGAGFANLAVPKFGLRALAQSMARELAPKGLHVAHTIIDGQIASERYSHLAQERGPDSLLAPDAIAEAYYQLHLQDRSAWTFELDLRPWVERF